MALLRVMEMQKFVARDSSLGGDETKAVRNDKGVTRKFTRLNRDDRLDDNARFVIAIQVGVDDSVA